MKNIVFILFLALLFINVQSQDNIKVPENFRVNIIADNLGEARHLTIAPNGNIFIKLGELKNGKGIVQLTKLKNGKYKIKYFGNFSGTGIYIKDNYLYASSNENIYRYMLNNLYEVINENSPELIVKNLINKYQHAAKSIVLDQNNNIYVNIGAYSNACQEKDRQMGSSGLKPCPILEHAGGIWKFSTEKKEQTLAEGKRYATGLRNVVGLDWNNETNSLFAMQHGRDQLYELYPKLFTAQQGADLPAECMYQLNQGDDCGWPYMYYDPIKKQKILAPEYGGDGKIEYKEAKDPIMYFPAHLAPNGLLFYRGKLFPENYRNGAFIAFHGSWNRGEFGQEGYYVAFAPFKNGQPINNEWSIFANGFSGQKTIKSSNEALYRPCGLAQDIEGNLYVSDDVKGRIYKISYSD